MKKIVYIALFFSAVAFTGCDEEKFLREEPKDAMFADNLFTSYDGFRMAVNALVAMPRQERTDRVESAEAGLIWKIGVDNGWANTELSWTRGINQYNVDFNPEMRVINDGNGIFLYLYRAITSANLVISRAEESNVDWQGLTAEENQRRKNLILAHAHLIRAWAYRHLAYTFGPVPISTEEINGLTYRNDWVRNPIPEVQQLIISDLLFAEQHLAENSDNVLELSKAIAQHYLAEIYLWMGNAEEAEKYALRVTQNPRYALITQRYGVQRNQPGVPFMDQFKQGNVLPSQGNTEALWVFKNTDVMNQPGGSNNSMRRSWVINYNNYAPITLEHGGRGIGRLAISAWGFSIYEPQDDRFSEHAVRKYYTAANGTRIQTQMDFSQMNVNNNRWASTRKWDWTYDDPNLWATTNYSFNDQPYLRLAETYLLLAEAQMKLGKHGEAAEWINKIRRRSNASEIGPGQVTLDFILDERSRELVTEEHRRETLVRTGKLLERARLNKYAANIQPRHVLLPIPRRVIEANTGAPMAQNE